jgi:hypothetical protein
VDDIKSLTDRLSDSANEFWTAVGDYLPKIFAALVLLVLALVIAKLAQWVVERILQLVKFDKLIKNKQVEKSLNTAEISIDFIALAGRIAFWVVIIIFAITIVDVLELDALRDVIRNLLGYLPNVLAAAIVLTVAVAGGRLVRDVFKASLNRMRIDFAHTIATVSYYVIILFGTVMAIDQLGFDTTILAANITVIVAGIVLALALAFGLGGRDLAGRTLENAYQTAKKHKK